MLEEEMKPANGDPSTDPAHAVVLQLHSSFEAFGVVCDYLSRIEPFSHYEVGHFSTIIRHQLKGGHHLIAMRGQTVVGYAGWLLTTIEIGDLWQQNLGKLLPVADHLSNAAALTIVTSLEKRVITRLMRGARTLNPEKRVYFKRQYDGDDQSARKSSVKNKSSNLPATNIAKAGHLWEK